MKATYGPLRIEIEGLLTPQSDFCIGAPKHTALHTDLPVLLWRQNDGDTPFLPGSSIRGVLRSHLDRERSLLDCDENHLLALFGYAGRKGEEDAKTLRGRLRIFDSIGQPVTPEPDAPAYPSGFEVRDHVCIDKATGAAAESAKFDAERVPKDTPFSFPFRLIYEGDEEDVHDLKLLRECIRALENEELYLDSRSAIGCGRFKLKVKNTRVFRRATEDGLCQFLASRFAPTEPAAEDGDDRDLSALVNCEPQAAGGGEKEQVPPAGGSLQRQEASSQRPFNLLEIQLRVRCNGPLLIQAPSLPAAEHQKLKELKEDPVHAKYLRALDGKTPVIPGSSLRGVLRQRAFKICQSQYLGDELAERLFGSVKSRGGGRKGMVRFSEGKVVLNEADQRGEAPQRFHPVTSDHLAVDRITHAAADGAKFDDEALDGPECSFSFSIEFTDEPIELECTALFLMLVRDLQHDGSGITIGSRTSRGYGSIHKAAIQSLCGSFYGKAAILIPGHIKTNAAKRSNRVVFPADESNANDPAGIFDALCSGFDAFWQRARARRIPA